MSIELMSLYVFCLSILLTIFAQASVLIASSGFAYVSGNRDGGPDNASPVIGRLERAVRNSTEAAVVFVPLVFIAAHTGNSNPVTEMSAIVFVIARLAYVLSYALGITVVRTLVWNIGAISTAVFGAGILIG